MTDSESIAQLRRQARGDEATSAPTDFQAAKEIVAAIAQRVGRPVATVKTALKALLSAHNEEGAIGISSSQVLVVLYDLLAVSPEVPSAAGEPEIVVRARWRATNGPGMRPSDARRLWDAMHQTTPAFESFAYPKKTYLTNEVRRNAGLTTGEIADLLNAYDACRASTTAPTTAPTDDPPSVVLLRQRLTHRDPAFSSEEARVLLREMIAIPGVAQGLIDRVAHGLRHALGEVWNGESLIGEELINLLRDYDRLNPSADVLAARRRLEEELRVARERVTALQRELSAI